MFPPLQLLATAEEETGRHAEEAALLHRAHEAQAVQAAAAEERAANLLRQRLDLQHRVEELEAAGAERAGVAAAQEAELVQLRGDLARARTEGLALAEDKARLEVRGRQSHGVCKLLGRVRIRHVRLVESGSEVWLCCPLYHCVKPAHIAVGSRLPPAPGGGQAGAARLPDS